MIIDQLKTNLKESEKILSHFLSDASTWEVIDKAGSMMVSSISSGGKIISCGNGGSMCDAIHFAEELTGRFQENRRPLPAIAISDPAHITCVANDFGFEYIFARTIEAIGKPEDILLAITTSGNSENIVRAIEAARQKGMKTVALTGKSGGRVASLCDVEIRVAHSGYSDRIQEIHVKVVHSLVQYIEMSLFQ
jgi:D-sedoheptulose 7-phosphate isomerase